MKTVFDTQQLFMPKEIETWVLDDFGDLPLPRKALTDASIEAFRGRSGPPSLEQHLFESLFISHIGEPS